MKKISNPTKYGIEYEIVWADNIGRFVATFSSPGLAYSTQYLLGDGDFFDDEFGNDNSDHGTRILEEQAEKLLGLNFWLLCAQKEAQTASAANTGMGTGDTVINA